MQLQRAACFGENGSDRSIQEAVRASKPIGKEAQTLYPILQDTPGENQAHICDNVQYSLDAA